MLFPIIIKASGAAVFIATLLLSLTGCAQKPVSDTVVWQQQLNLPSVKYSAEVSERLWLNIEEINFNWLDQSRDRVVPALLFKPARQQKATALVIFSHGLGGSKERYAYLG